MYAMGVQMIIGIGYLCDLPNLGNPEALQLGV